VNKLVTVLDCADPKALATFWAGALGYKEVAAGGQYVVLGTGNRAEHELILQGVAEPKTGKNRMHLDIHAPDIEAEADRLVGLGARRVEGPIEEWGERWIVLADPEGNELCVCTARQ
jgi:catechol 2,3-dioxygenase-like lactoylglutathione lyase family enzyme